MQKRKLAVYLMAVAMLATSMPVTAYAEPAAGTQEIESSSLIDDKTSANVPVQYTVDATFTVKLPSSITLSNTDGSWGYSGTVGVKGDIDSGKVVKVTPAESVTMYDVTNRPTEDVPAGAEDQAYDHKDAKNVTVAQTKKQWSMTELSADTYSDTDLTLTAGAMQSGKWKGKLNVNISYVEYVEEPGLYGSDGSFTPWSTLVSDRKITVTDNVIQSGSNTSMEGRLVIADGITSLGSSAFKNCSNLKNISIPESVTSIGSSAFSKCSNLKNVNIPESVTSIELATFAECSNITNINIPESVKSIGVSAFVKCSSLTGITIPGSVTSIGENAFNNCKSLTSVDIPNGVTSIKAATFSDCSNLTSISIPESVTSIELSAFSGCSNLKSVNIPDSVTSIRNNAFFGCSNLKSVNIPDSVTDIGGSVFMNCSGLTSVTISGALKSISPEVFAGCDSLTDVNIHDGVKSIYDNAFGSSNLTHITIPSSVTYIDMRAFYGCSNLTDVTFAGTMKQWSAVCKVTGTYDDVPSSWHDGIPATVVHCSDGDVPI